MGEPGTEFKDFRDSATESRRGLPTLSPLSPYTLSSSPSTPRLLLVSLSLAQTMATNMMEPTTKAEIKDMI